MLCRLQIYYGDPNRHIPKVKKFALDENKLKNLFKNKQIKEALKVVEDEVKRVIDKSSPLFDLLPV